MLFLAAVLFSCRQSVEIGKDTAEFLGEGAYAGEYWPTTGWRTCRPEEVGMDSRKLLQVYTYAANPNIKTQALILIRKGNIVGEAYFRGFTANTKHESFSVAKSFASALIGIAIDKGLIPGVDVKVSRYYPEWQKEKTPAAKKRMTIKHLLTMTSGLKWNEEDYYGDRSQNDVYIMIEDSQDYTQYVLDRPIIHEPGEHWYYSSGDSMLLSGIIEQSTKMTACRFARKYLFAPLGLSEVIWLRDPAGHTITAWGIQATAREFAKFGYLYLRRGRWENRQIVSEDWIDKSLRPVSDEITKYGYQWWRLPVLAGYETSIIPPKTFIAWGIYTQQIFVIPEEDMVIVRLGNDANPYDDDWREVEFLTLVLQSLQK
jgi:CubicO group peptidase (beta-lactamase class C family)